MMMFSNPIPYLENKKCLQKAECPQNREEKHETKITIKQRQEGGGKEREKGNCMVKEGDPNCYTKIAYKRKGGEKGNKTRERN